MNLNEEQKLAVRHELDSPALVLASAGSGKTTVLTARIKYLIEEKDVAPNKIAAITFTNKAAAELQHRLGYDPKNIHELKPRACTIHSLALSAIRKDPRGFGLDDKISPLDDYAQKEMIDKLLVNLGPDTGVKSWDFLERIQYHRARGLGFASDYTPEVHERTKHMHGGYHMLSESDIKLWAMYEQEKKVQSVVDFDDMLHLVIARGQSDEAWRIRLGSAFDYILVDECQDCSKMHIGFINLLMREGNYNLFLVGDVSQSIYGFSGASPELTLEFLKEWRGREPKLYKLISNHRSVPQVVRFANLIQSKMVETVSLQMKSHRGEKGESGSIKLMSEMTARDNAAKMAEQIWDRNQLLIGKVLYKDTAILVRSASQINDIESELVRCRVPYIIKGGKGLLQTLEAREILSYMRIVVNPKDVYAMTRSVSVPKRGIGDATIAKIKKIADDKYEGNLIKAATQYSHNKMGMYLDFLSTLTSETRPDEAFKAIIKFTKYYDIVNDRYKKDREQLEWKCLCIQRLEEIFCSFDENTTLEDVVFQMTMNDKDVIDETGDGKVTISTIHSSKGLEWNFVYVYNLYEGSLPHMWSQSEKEIEEERRLFYVAVTRARDHLTLCVPLHIHRGSSIIQVTPSRFLFETGVIRTSQEEVI